MIAAIPATSAGPRRSIPHPPGHGPARQRLHAEQALAAILFLYTRVLDCPLAPPRDFTRLLECAELRVKDLDLERREILVRDGKGQKDRITKLPLRLVAPLRDHLVTTRAQHTADLTAGAGWVALPKSPLDAIEHFKRTAT